MSAAGLQLVRLLQLASPALPVGAYTYSQGLEWAVETGVIRDEASAGRWIGDLLAHGIGRYEAPLVAALMAAWRAGESAEVARLNAEFLASRESAELRAETAQMGFSLARLVRDLRDPALAEVASVLAGLPEIAFPTGWAGVAAAWQIAPEAAVGAYLWSWAENQVMAASRPCPSARPPASVCSPASAPAYRPPRRRPWRCPKAAGPTSPQPSPSPAPATKPSIRGCSAHDEPPKACG